MISDHYSNTKGANIAGLTDKSRDADVKHSKGMRRAKQEEHFGLEEGLQELAHSGRWPVRNEINFSRPTSEVRIEPSQEEEEECILFQCTMPRRRHKWRWYGYLPLCGQHEALTDVLYMAGGGQVRSLGGISPAMKYRTSYEVLNAQSTRTCTERGHR
jgi:hypothetical protein